MARDLKKMLRADRRTFNLLATGPTTSQQMATALERSNSTAVHSLARLVLYGLATTALSKQKLIGNGSVAWIWTIVPGAVFPEPAPRKNGKGRPKGARTKVEQDDAPLVQVRRTGHVPPEVAQRVGLAGLVSQMRGKD